MRTEFLCIYVLRVASGPRVKLASCKSALNPPVVCSTDRSKAVVPVLVLLLVALWFILRGDLLYGFPCVILFLCFSVLLVLRLPRLGKRELILVLLVRLFGLCFFRFVGFSSSLGLGRAAVCDCGTPWTFLLPFFCRFILGVNKYALNLASKAELGRYQVVISAPLHSIKYWQCRLYFISFRIIEPILVILKIESPIFVILCVLCFQRQAFLTFILSN